MNKLDEIMAWKRREIQDRLREVEESELACACPGDSARPGFADALRRRDGLAIIAEIKRRSPSAGTIAGGISAVDQARRYAAAKADALSVLTDENYFGGSLDDLRGVTGDFAANPPGLPCLRKDFMVHPVQVIEAIEAGAAAILIIIRALTDDEIRVLFHAARIAGLDAIFEVHNEEDVERALKANARIVGVNNRDLARFATDLAVSEKLIPLIPDPVIKISESGIFTAGDAARARAAGADAVLVGEALMRAPDPAELIAAFRKA